MEAFYSRDFTNLGNSILNASVRVASTAKCTEVNCAHILVSVLNLDESLAQTFEKLTGLTKDDFTGIVGNLADHGVWGVNKSGKELSLDDVSLPAYNIIRDLLKGATATKKKAGSTEIFYAILTDTNTENEVYRVLSAVGLDPKAIRASICPSPLANMPFTSTVASDLCSMASEGKLDPVIGRDDIIDKVIETLGRRTKGNPCLIGDPGVGKTSIVEGLAQRIVEGRVPDYLKDARIINLDISGIVSGTRFRGDFEDKLNRVLYETEANPGVILFIDEIHTIMGAGASSENGALDAANIIKPAITKGNIRIIGATTSKEYSKFIEGDGAFERRLQSIVVPEPSIEDTITILKDLSKVYKQFHNCEVPDEVITACVKLSDRYITNRKLPDKAISVLDETAAHLKAAKTMPKLSEQFETKPNPVSDTIKKIRDKLSRKDGNIEGWLIEPKRGTLQDIDDQEIAQVDDKDTVKEVKPDFTITVDDIRETITRITGIDIQDVDDGSRGMLASLSDKLHDRVIGQDFAIESVVKAIRRAKAGVKDPNRPIGSYLFVGPTGVGKTELAKTLADIFGGGVKNLIRFDMSEFMEKFAVSRLVGAPPGYVGYDNGGQLTEQIKRNPYSVVLFDEIEKAHPDVFNILLQILDDGILTDSKGTKVDFKNTIIIMTSNAGYGQETGNKLGSIGFSTSTEPSVTKSDYAKAEEKAMKALESTFRPEFLNRLDKVIVFRSLSKLDCIKIVDIELTKLAKRLDERGIKLTWTPELAEFISQEGFSDKYGARNLKRKAQDMVEDTLADLIIDGEVSSGDKLKLDLDKTTNSVKIEHCSLVLEPAE